MKALCSAAVISLSLLSTPVFADFAVNVGMLSVIPDDSSSHLNVLETVAGFAADSTSVKVNTNTQLGLTLDYQYSKNWGVQLVAATPFSHDISGDGALSGLKVGNTKHLPPTLLAQYYFDLNNKAIQPFIGLGINYTHFFDSQPNQQLSDTLIALGAASSSDQVSLKLQNSWGLAAQAGVNVKLSDTVGMHFMVSKMAIDTTAEVQVAGSTVQQVAVTIDPLVAMLALRFSL